MSDLDILHEIEKEYDIKFEEISKEEWEEHLKNIFEKDFYNNQYFIENDKLIVLSFNGFNIVPSQLSRFEFLQKLYISKVSSQIGSITLNNPENLKVLCIRGDFHEGGIEKLPIDIVRLKNLRKLDISSNNNFKSLPFEIFNISALEFLDIGDTGIEDIPSEIENLKNLKGLSISYNENMNYFPTKICKLQNLEILDLSGMIIEKFPDEISELINLKKLDIRYNENLMIFPKEICELKNLETLYLTELNIRTIPKEIGKLKKLKELNIEKNEKLQTLPDEIGDLTALERLIVSETDLVVLPLTIGKLKNLCILDVSSTNLKSLPIEIVELSNLKELNVSNVDISNLPKKISNLKNLKRLYIGTERSQYDPPSKKVNTIPSEIGELENLEILNIGNFDIREIPKEIGQLLKLDTLIIHGNDKLFSLPKEIGELKNLEKLRIEQTGIQEIPKEIGNLINLEELSINSNKFLSSLPEEICQLKKLKELSLYGNDKIDILAISKIIKNLSNTQIESLDLSGYAYLKFIPCEITTLVHLNSLHLNDCNISTLNIDWEGCKGLQSLNLSENKISDIEPLSKLENIKSIDLTGNKDIISIPEPLIQIQSLEEIKIDYLQNKNLMEEIEKNDKDVIKGAREYYRKKRETLSQIQKQVKVILIGDGNSGKTSLLRRLLLDGFSDNSATTHGIRLEEDYFEIGNDKVKIKYWDMGGQDVYHSPHSFFFSDNTIYLLVLDARKEEAPDYWIEQIQSYGNSRDKKRKSPVLVVVNKIDAYPSHELDISRLEEKIELIGSKVFEVSAFENKGIKEIENALYDFIEGQLANNTRLINRTGEQYKELLKEIYNLRFDASFKDREYLRQEEFNELLKKNKLQSQKEVLVKELQELGAILSFPHPKIQNPLYVYKPEWLIDKIYHLFKVAKNEKDGMIDILDLPRILDCKESQEVKFIKNIIEQVFELAFSKTTANGESYLFIPDALPFKKEGAAKINKDNTTMIQIKFSELNRRIISNCMIEFSKKLSEQKIWKTEMILKIREDEILMETFEENRFINFHIPNLIAKEGLALIQNSLSELKGENLNFPETFVFVQVPDFLLKETSQSKCMVEIEDAKFYWNQTEEIKNLYFPSLGITKPIPLDEVLKFYGIEAHEKRMVNYTKIPNKNTGDSDLLDSLEKILHKSNDDINITNITKEIHNLLKDKYSQDDYIEKLGYWIPEYKKLAPFSIEALLDAFYSFETIQKARKSNYTSVVFQLARAFEEEMDKRIFKDFISYCSNLHNLGDAKIEVENYTLNNYKSEFSESISDFKEIPDLNIMKSVIGKFRTAINSGLNSKKPDYDLNCIVFTFACSHLMKDDGNLFVKYFKKFLNEKFHYDRIGNNEFAASIIELKELRNKAAHKGTHFNEEQGKLVWKKMTYFFQDWTRALKNGF